VETINDEVVKKRLDLYSWLRNGGNAIKVTFYRFPITILLFIILASILIYKIGLPYERLREYRDSIDRVMGAVGFGIAFSLFLKILLEKMEKADKILNKIIIYVINIVFMFLYYFFLFPDIEMVSVTRLLFIISALLISFLFIPYFLKKESFEIYITKIIIKFIVSAFFTVVLALGVMAIVFAIKSLLYESLDEKFYLYTWIAGWLIFAPIHFLQGFPYMKDSFEKDDYNKVLKVLLSYIVLPVISIYTVVLYIYFAKIIITKVWPSGIVSYLVSSYAAVGIAASFLAWPLRKNNKWVKIFTSVYTKLIFPLLIMMYISIGIRINEFGFTENRYYILVIGIWATLVMIFININKGKTNIFFFISLAVICITTVIGPVSAFNTSINSQNHRFYSILQKYEMIENGEVVKKNADVNVDDKKEITGIINYFERNHQLSDLKYLPEGYKQSEMEEVFGFPEYYGNPDKERSYINYRRKDEPINIFGYDLLFNFETYKDYSELEGISFKNNNYKINVENNTINLEKNGDNIYSYEITNHINYLEEKYGFPDYSKSEINTADMFVEDQNDNVEVKIIFESIGGRKEVPDRELNLTDIKGYFLVKLK
jgi:hypothetical protein